MTFKRGEVTSTELASKLVDVRPRVFPTDSSLDDPENSSKLEELDILTKKKEVENNLFDLD